MPQHAGLEFEQPMLEDWMGTALEALSALRTGVWVLDGSRDERTLAELYTAINAVITRLGPRLEGLADALVRAHRDAGGSYGELATALNAPRSTASSRIQRLAEPPKHWEKWATGSLSGTSASSESQA